MISPTHQSRARPGGSSSTPSEGCRSSPSKLHRRSVARSIGFLVSAGLRQPSAPRGGKLALGVVQGVCVAGGLYVLHEHAGDRPSPSSPIGHSLLEDAPHMPTHGDGNDIVVLARSPRRWLAEVGRNAKDQGHRRCRRYARMVAEGFVLGLGLVLRVPIGVTVASGQPARNPSFLIPRALTGSPAKLLLRIFPTRFSGKNLIVTAI